MANALNGIGKAEVIERIVRDGIERKAWRDAVAKDCLRCLDKVERVVRKADVLAFVKAQFDAAGAGFSGRWQS